MMPPMPDKRSTDASDCQHVEENEYCTESYTELYYYTKSTRV